MNTNKKYFSLLELICVVAVVMTLFSVLVSSIKSSKDLGIQVACMSNISQIRNYVELYRKDNKMAPYSEIWLTDFSFVEPYLVSEGNDLHAFICPGSDDEALTGTEGLKYNTSYYYVPGRDILANNIADGQAFGFSLLNIGDLATKNQLVIYDKSPNHHNGKINTSYLFGDDDAGYSKEGKIIGETNEDDYLALDSTGQLDLEDAESFGSLNINPSNSTDTLFTLTDPDGNIIEIRSDGISGTGQAVSITIKVKSTGRTLVIDDEEFVLQTNRTYEISATPSDDSVEDPYYIYELTNESDSEGNATGKWWIDLFSGIGSITITEL
jgi:type II secretory pathway pseudopilin PulG